MSKKYFPLVLFLLGFGIFMFSRASRVIPFIIPGGIAMLIAPIFILRFIRTQPTRKRIWLTLLGFLLSANIALWGLFEIGHGFYRMLFSLVYASMIAIIFFFPYAMDRLIYPKLQGKGILATLSFPILVTATLFLVSLEGPFDGDAIFAVYGYGILSFKQIASIAGLPGFVFIFSWLAAVINYGWENEFNWGKIKNVTVIFVSILLIIFLFGAIKTSSLITPESDTVKMAAIILLPEEGGAVVATEKLFSKDPYPYEATESKIEHLAKEAASQNAKIVSFQEQAIKIHEEHETKLIHRMKNIAKEHDLYVSVTYGVLPEEGKGWNKHVLINNQGEVEIEYRKRYLKGFGDIGETAIYKKGPEIIQTADTPYGRIGVSICRDMEFSSYARQAGQKDVDIMLNPSLDYPKSEGPMNSLRAIENGFSLVRPVYNGYSYAVDYNGRVVAHMDSDETETGIMYADVPTKGVKTIYTTIGNLLGWLCVLGLLGCIALTIILPRKT
jgi:apolipoprotein N-acyltransferase